MQDLMLVMDQGNLAAVQNRCPPDQLHKVQLLTAFCQTHQSANVPDPYYGGAQGFERVLDLIEDACGGVLSHVQTRLQALPQGAANTAP